jgi:hypothetical protein
MVRRQRRAGRNERGQAAVESAIVLTLLLFCLLGIIQLASIQNARALTQYAVFNAVRAGAVGYGDCTRMTHAAFTTLLPAIEPFTASSPGDPGQGMANAFAARFTPPSTFKYSAVRDAGMSGEVHDRDILWLRREQPTKAVVDSFPPGQNDEFDDPEITQAQLRLEVEMVFWFKLNIPFANWVISRLALAHWGLIAFTERNPIVNNGQFVDWSEDLKPPPFDALIAAELADRVNNKMYEFPLRGSYTMRMMTPAKDKYFLTQNCPPVVP